MMGQRSAALKMTCSIKPNPGCYHPSFVARRLSTGRHQVDVLYVSGEESSLDSLVSAVSVVSCCRPLPKETKPNRTREHKPCTSRPISVSRRGVEEVSPSGYRRAKKLSALLPFANRALPQWVRLVHGHRFERCTVIRFSYDYASSNSVSSLEYHVATVMPAQ